VEADPHKAPSVVSVVVVHDPGEWFDETLAALAAQDYPNMRFLFLVVGDPDAELLEAVTVRIRSYLPAAFIRGIAGNPGYGPAANEVLRLVEGDNGFFLLCHDDVAPAADAVRTMVTELYRSNAGMVGPKLVEWDEPRRLQHVGLGLDRFGEVDPIVEPGEVDQEQHDAVRDVFVLPSACILVRADLLRELSGFDPAVDFHGDDVDLCWRAHLHGARVVVAPDARVRHLEGLEERRPDLNHRRLRARHRMRVVATLTGGSRLVGRSVQIVLLTVVELIVGLFTGRVGEALSSLRAMFGLIPRSLSLVARRRAIRAQRSVPEREVLGLQVRGSARISSYLRGRETTTYVRAGMTVRRWRETSFGPLLAWFIVLVAIAIGSRTYFDRGVPTVGEFLTFPVSPRELAERYGSAWDPRSFGVTSPVPSGWLALAVLSGLALFRMGLAMTLSVVGLFVVGAAGMWRLAAVFPANRSRIAAMVVYVATPLVPGVLGTGRWSVLVWYAALPWMVYLLRRAVGIGTADPDSADDDLTDGIGPTSRRDRLRYMALSSLVLGLTAAFAPVTVVLWLGVGVVLSAATLIAGGTIRTAGWLAATTAVATVVAVVLNLPWSTTWSWAALVGPSIEGPRGDGLVDLASLALDGRDFAVLAVALYLPVVVAVAVSRAWRLTWAVRAAAVVLAFGALAVFADRGALPFDAPEKGMMLVPVALGVALASAVVTGAIGADVRGRGFGWRQPVAVLGNLAVVVGIVPAVTSIGDGAWDAPRTPLPTLLGAQLPLDPAAGDYRVLYVGDPRVLPVPGHEYRDGIAFAVVDDGPLDFTDRWSPPESDADQVVIDVLDRIANGATLRAGALFAPIGIRFIVLPEIDGAQSTVDDPVPAPSGLIEALSEQLDISVTYGPPTIQVFEVGPWIPTTAHLTGPTADASRLAGDDVLVRADLSERTPILVGDEPSDGATADVTAGVVHVAAPFDDRLRLRAGDLDVEPRPGFGVTTAFDIAQPTSATLDYTEPTSRVFWLVLQAAVWLAVFAVASRARSPFGRRRGELLTDETLIDLDELPPPAASSLIAGEVLGAGIAWRPDIGASHEPDTRPTGAPALEHIADDAELGRSLDELAEPT
jgi:GT2 family glycosyltransferase